VTSADITGTARTEYRQARFQRPPGATELVLVRHGESAPARPGEPFPLVDGHGDPELHPEGVAQAERVGERLAAEAIDAVYVTTLRRTVQTAAPLVARTGLTPVVNADLREVYLGEWEGGLFRQRVAAKDPVATRMWREQRWDVIPGAESTEALGARVRRGIENIVADHPDQKVAVFTHGGVIGQILAEATGSRSLAFIGADNGSLSRLVITDGWWIVRSFNDTSHLNQRHDW
jgi:2,3-bisphosphoglycerate-dependent phosphoglycerate mutase